MGVRGRPLRLDSGGAKRLPATIFSEGQDHAVSLPKLGLSATLSFGLFNGLRVVGGLDNNRLSDVAAFEMVKPVVHQRGRG